MVKFSKHDDRDCARVRDVLKSYINSAVPTIRSRIDKEKNQRL